MIDAAPCSHSLCWNKRPFIATTTRLLHFYKFYKFNMPSKKVQSTDASRDTADGAPRHGGRPGTRAWAQAHPTADDAAAEPQADAPDNHLQEAGGDVAGAEDNSNAAAERPSITVGDDADAAASQARTAQRLADWLADTQDDDAWTHAAEAFSRRGIRLQRPTQNALGDQPDSADPDSSAAHAESRASQDEDFDLESDSGDGTPPWARQTNNAPVSLADGGGADTPSGPEFDEYSCVSWHTRRAPLGVHTLMATGY